MDINNLFSTPAQKDDTVLKEKQKKLSLVSYLNTKPLVYGLEQKLVEHSFTLQKDVPSVCARRLIDQEVEIGIIPSIEYARAKGALKIIPDLSISSREQVKSVMMFFREDLKKINRIAVDTSSRTSVALLKVLLQEKYEITPEFIPMAPDLESMLGNADAALIIGDKALNYQVDWPNKLDLASEWFDLTGLPFVFAFWAGTENGIEPEDVKAIQESYEIGRKNIQKICEVHADSEQYDWNFYADYLNNNISYTFSEEEKEGLLEFYRFAFYYGLIEFIPELHFYDQ